MRSPILGDCRSRHYNGKKEKEGQEEEALRRRPPARCGRDPLERKTADLLGGFSHAKGAQVWYYPRIAYVFPHGAFRRPGPKNNLKKREIRPGDQRAGGGV